MVAILSTDVGVVYKLEDDDKKRYGITDDYMIGNRQYNLVGNNPSELVKEMMRCMERTRRRLMRRAM